MPNLQTTGHPRPYMIQWERTLRWHDRAQTAISDDADVATCFDYLIALFVNILDMRDWMINSRVVPKADVLDLFRSSSRPGLARDVANAAKHMALSTYSVESAAAVAREYDGPGRTRLVVPRAGAPNVEALPLAYECVSEIQDFMSARGLL